MRDVILYYFIKNIYSAVASWQVQAFELMTFGSEAQSRYHGAKRPKSTVTSMKVDVMFG